MHSPLHWACIRDDRFMAKLLLDARISPTLIDMDGHSPAYYAFKAKSSKILLVNFLIFLFLGIV